MTPGRMATAIVALLAVAGLIVLVRDAGTATSTTVVAAPTSTVPAAAAAESPTTVTATPATPAKAAGSAARAPGPTPVAAGMPVKGAPAPGVVPGPVAPPAPGTFRYRYAGTAPTVEGTLTITAGPGAQRQTQRLAAGAGSEQTVVEWSAGGRTTVSAGVGGAPACTWSPGLLSLKLPLSPGATWRADSTCTQASSTIHRTEDAKVEGATRTSLSGRQVDVWVISRHTVTEVTGGGAGKAVVEAQSSELFAPSLGLVVYDVTRTATPQADGTTATTTQTAELLDDRPV